MVNHEDAVQSGLPTLAAHARLPTLRASSGRSPLSPLTKLMMDNEAEDENAMEGSKRPKQTELPKKEAADSMQVVRTGVAASPLTELMMEDGRTSPVVAADNDSAQTIRGNCSLSLSKCLRTGTRMRRGGISIPAQSTAAQDGRRRKRPQEDN